MAKSDRPCAGQCLHGDGATTAGSLAAGMTKGMGGSMPMQHLGRPVVYHSPASIGGKKKNWIAGAIGKPGALHAQMGVPQGQTIPAGKLAKAAQAGGLLGKRARLAETLKGFH